MADITNPAAVKFCNEQLRPSADQLIRFYWYLKAVQLQYTANPSIAAALPNDAASVVKDGSETDGRTPLTGADAQAIITQLGSLITSLEANNKLILNVFGKAAVNIH